MSKPITTDDLILWHYNPKPRPSPFWLLPAIVAAAIALTGYFWGVERDAFFLPCAIVWTMSVVTMSVVLLVYFSHNERHEWALKRKLDQVPMELQLNALAMYPDNGEWMIVAIECYEAHMPGECPLCGAT